MSKVKQISPNNTINKISRKAVIKVEKFAKAEYEKCFNWIPAGSQIFIVKTNTELNQNIFRESLQIGELKMKDVLDAIEMTFYSKN